MCVCVCVCVCIYGIYICVYIYIYIYIAYFKKSISDYSQIKYIKADFVVLI